MPQQIISEEEQPVSVLDKETIELLNRLASKSPVPGGGGAAALGGAIGTALGTMVGNLTLGKKKYVDVEREIQVLYETTHSS